MAEPRARYDPTGPSEFTQPALLPMDTAQRGRGPFVWRFTLTHRVFHALVILTFYTLVLTGVPLRYADAPFSGALMGLWGGVARAGLIHRVAAAVMVAYSLVFLVWLTRTVVRAEDRKRLLWGPDSLMFHPEDARDFLRMWRWFFTGKGRPRFGRYGYLEKLDFFGELWGFVVIGGSGLILWFPEFWGRWLPGWWFNVATVFHGYEALIAAGFIFMVHFFNVHLRPDKFPLDAVMFHGRATTDYMLEEHPLMGEELARLREAEVSRVPAPDRPAPPPSRWTSLVAALFGFFALAVGLLCIGLVLWAVVFS